MPGNVTPNFTNRRIIAVKDLAIDHFAELLDLAAYGLASLLVSGLGIGIERDAVVNLLAGAPMLGLWELFMGAIAIYVGVYLLAFGEVRPRLAAIR